VYSIIYRGKKYESRTLKISKKGDLVHGYEQVLVHVPIPKEEFKPETAKIVIRRKHFQATKNKIGAKIKLV
jgi:hypothetical protein